MLRRFALTAVLVALTITLGGCTMTAESRLDEYHTEADLILAETVELIPAELVDNVGFAESEPRFGATEGTPAPSDPAWWQAYEGINLVATADASADAAEAIANGLGSDGWRDGRVRETEDGARIADGYRKEIDGANWYIEVTWVTTRAGKAEVIEVLVVSPQTVRGDNDWPT